MPALGRTTLSLVALGDDLVGAEVALGPGGVSVRELPVVRSFVSHAPDEVRRVLGASAAPGEIVFTCAPAHTAVRPIGVDIGQWSSARDEVVRSIARLFPMDPSDALVGLVARAPDPAAPDEGAGAGSFLVGVSRAAIAPWLERINAAFGREPDAVLAPQMLLAGIGLQDAENAIVIDERPHAGAVAHRLSFGRAVALEEAWDGEANAGASLSGVSLRRWPTSGEDAGAAGGVDAIAGAEAAAAASIVRAVSPGTFAPLTGRRRRARPAWLAPVAAAIGVAALLWGAAEARDWRYERAIDDLRAREASLDTGFAETSRRRAEAIRLGELVDEVRGRTAADPRVEDALVAVRRVLPDGAFLYALEADAERVVLRGEARSAADVLRAVERAPEFDEAVQADPPASVAERGGETFHIRARRVRADESGGGA